MEIHESIDISMESIDNITFESIRYQKKRADIPIIIKYIYKSEENITL